MKKVTTRVRKNVFLFAAVLFAAAIILGSQGVAHATTKWYKIAPSTCSIWSYGELTGEVDNLSMYGDLGFCANVWPRQIFANCELHLNQGVTMNLLRARDFQSGGMPVNSSSIISIYRRSWDGSGTELATVTMTSGYSSVDASFSSTINNDAYQYVVMIELGWGNNGAGTSPWMDMIEIRYDE